MKILKAIAIIPAAFAFILFIGAFGYAMLQLVKGLACAVNPFA